MRKQNIALIFAGGVGTRMKNGSTPKQFLELNSKPIIIYTLEKFEECDEISDIIVVCVQGWIEYLEKLVEKFKISKVRFVVEGGATPIESQYNGMIAVSEKLTPDENSVVLLHDGVRPLVDSKTIIANIKSARKNGSAITITPAIETIVSIGDKKNIIDVADRSQFMMAKAPQSYNFNNVFQTYQLAFTQHNTIFVDSAALMNSYGKSLTCVEGDTDNIKITTPVDYFIFKGILEARNQESIFR